MYPHEERRAAFHAWWTGVRAFRQRPFPTEYARVVEGVGLASFSMRIERSLAEIVMRADFKPSYLRRTGVAQSTAEELRQLLEEFDRFLPALPQEPATYFRELRSLVAGALELIRVWWSVDEPEPPT